MLLLIRLCLILAFGTLAGITGGLPIAPAGWAQSAPAATTTEGAPPAEAPAPAPAPDEATIAWQKLAARAEAAIDNPATRSDRLEALRAELAQAREGFLAGQSQNASRIENLREQLAALTPAAEGTAEDPMIAARRAELTEQLARAQAPGIAAEEAYRRADGLIREADDILRARQTRELVARNPAPGNPATWPTAFGVLSAWTLDLATEIRRSWEQPLRRAALTDAAPLLLVELAIALLLIWQGRVRIGALIERLQGRLTPAWWRVSELPLSLLQVMVPTLAVWVLVNAFERTGFPGLLSRNIAAAAVPATFAYALTTWIGSHIFPKSDAHLSALPLPPERRREGRVLVTLFAGLGALQTLIFATLTEARYGEYALLLKFPFTLLSGLLLFRIGQLLGHVSRDTPEGEDPGAFWATIIKGLSKAAMLIGIAGPLLGLLGFLTLADAIVRPAMVTLGVLALVTLLQRLIYDLYALVTRADPALARDALIPVLISALLLIAALPLLALVWGMRPAELAEYWSRFQEGFRVGDSRISPVDFLMLLLVFGVGYGLTRLIQGALRGTILPKTSLDTGSRNAIVAGIGYGGIVLAALTAISAAGLDMSSLAMVASALSVGIGFGLQNIVQNFISGVILLIERPVAEGDWVEVGGVQGIVRGISIRSTRVETFDRNSVIVPNASLISGQVTNFTAFNQSGRVIVPISVGYESNTRRVEQILREIAEAQPMVVLTPPPAVQFTGFGADGLNFEIRAILRDINFSGAVRTEINHQIMERFSAEGIAIPFAQREIRILNPEGLIPPAPAASPAG